MNSKETILEVIESKGFTAEEAEIIYQVYIKFKIFSIDKTGGRVNVAHGAFMDKHPMQRALESEVTS